MSQTRKVNYVAASDTLFELQDTVHLLDAIGLTIEENMDAKKAVQSVSYLLSIYRDKLSELMPRLERIIEDESLN